MEDQHKVQKNQLSNQLVDIDEQNIISLSKFIILCIASFGTYIIWWIYKSWRFFQQKENADLMPALRALFSIFFLNSLLNRILEFAKDKGYKGNYSSILLFIAFIICNLLSRLPAPFYLISIFSFIFLIPAFNALNYAKRNSTDFVVTEQPSFNGRQIGLIVFGLIFWCLVLLGLSIENV